MAIWVNCFRANLTMEVCPKGLIKAIAEKRIEPH